MGRLFLDTLAALASPRRLSAIVVVAIPLLVAQHRFSQGEGGVFVALALLLTFLCVAPFAFRALFPSGREVSRPALRLLVFGLLGGFAPLIAYVIPHGLGIGTSFLATGVNLLVATSLFWVGGFGLARDIELEERWHHERARAETMTELAEQAQLLALRSHLDPHFLFNTLNAIAEWCREDATVAEKAVLQLSTILRGILDGVSRTTWPLRADIELLEGLFELHQIRDPQRFEIEWEIAVDPESIEIPPLILLPLAENAMKHGPGAGHRGTVKFSAKPASDGRIQVRIDNPGPYRGKRDGSHGLPTIQKRLALSYRGAAEMEIDGDETTTQATLLFPTKVPNRGSRT